LRYLKSILEFRKNIISPYPIPCALRQPLEDVRPPTGNVYI
jgi:hypothetical protein